MTKKLTFNFDATGIGSVPFNDPTVACDVIFDLFRSIPFSPQLPKRSYLENMYVQFSERLPGLVLDDKARTIHIETSRVAQDIETVYSKYVDGDVDFFSISKPYAAGLYEFLKRLDRPPKDARFVKTQITGPVSFALSVTDQNKRAIIYDKDLFDILTKVLSMRARWQIKRIREKFPNVIVFIDEPYLVSMGSSFVNVDITEAFKRIDELAAAIRNEGALTGLHCCGNTDWSSILARDIDILSFDAYNFIREFSIYGESIKGFLKKGGAIAWGIVPTSEAVEKESKRSLVERFEESTTLLKDKAIRDHSIPSMITPSCGVGTLDEKRARKILELTKALSDGLKAR